MQRLRSFRWLPAMLGGFVAGFAISGMAEEFIGKTYAPVAIVGVTLAVGLWLGLSGRYAWPRFWFGAATLCYVLPGIGVIQAILAGFLPFIYIGLVVYLLFVLVGILCTIMGSVTLKRLTADQQK